MHIWAGIFVEMERDSNLEHQKRLLCPLQHACCPDVYVLVVHFVFVFGACKTVNILIKWELRESRMVPLRAGPKG